MPYFIDLKRELNGTMHSPFSQKNQKIKKEEAWNQKIVKERKHQNNEEKKKKNQKK